MLSYCCDFRRTVINAIITTTILNVARIIIVFAAPGGRGSGNLCIFILSFLWIVRWDDALFAGEGIGAFDCAVLEHDARGGVLQAILVADAVFENHPCLGKRSSGGPHVNALSRDYARKVVS